MAMMSNKDKDAERFRAGKVDKDSMSAFADKTDALFARLAFAWSQQYFAPARSKLYDTMGTDGPHAFTVYYVSFHRGDKGWGLFIQSAQVEDGNEGEPVNTPIRAASNQHKDMAIDFGLESLDLRLIGAMESKREDMVKRQDKLDSLVLIATCDLNDGK